MMGDLWRAREESNHHRNSLSGAKSHPQDLRAAAREIRDPAHIKVHALRHSAAILLLSQGIHPLIVSTMLGHTTVNMTLNTYSDVSLDMQQPATDAMHRLFQA